MTTATPTAQPAGSPAPIKTARRPDESVGDYFDRVLRENSVPQDGSEFVTVTVYDANGNGGLIGQRRAQIVWTDFDEGAQWFDEKSKAPLEAGRYVLQLKAGRFGRAVLANQQFNIAGGSFPLPEPVIAPVAAPPAGGQGGSPVAPSTLDPTALFVSMFQAQSQMNNMLLQRIMQPQEPRNFMEELSAMRKFVSEEAREFNRGRRGDDTGSAIADAIREIAPMVAPVLNRMASRPPAPQPIQTVPQFQQIPASVPSPQAAPALPAMPAEPEAVEDDSPEAEFVRLLDELAPTLRRAAARDGDPALYADLIADTLAGQEVNVEASLGQFIPGILAHIIAERAGVPAAWMERVEHKLRNPDEPDAGDEPHEPADPPFEPTPPSPPATPPAKGGRKKKGAQTPGKDSTDATHPD